MISFDMSKYETYKIDNLLLRKKPIAYATGFLRNLITILTLSKSHLN